ncbi:uncharacterized protein LOC129237580 [Anastrepha obliqua]|uniref:uncharacterized protein LOC129237580 n=1 Tax=Anastrepha obliqua TaxID=95512 RepID=UPI00240A0E2A|nr:uncharacterized protein LOC129237580 [Anastrepha obliqua]
MKSICAWSIIFWLNWSFAAVGSTNVKTKRLAARVDRAIPIDSTTTPAPIEATTALVEVMSNKTSNSTAVNNNTIFYDHKHKILLVVLSDLNVREARDGQQSNSHNFITNPIKKNLSVLEKKLGNKPTDSHNAKKEILNETFILDEKWLTDLLKKLQITTDQDQGVTNGVEIKKCVNIVPHYVPPTFPWLIRKQQSKPIVYVEPIACEDTAKDGGVGSWENKNRKGRNQRTDPITKNVAHPRSKPLMSARKRQWSRTGDYVLMPRFGAAQEMTHLKYPFNYIHNIDYAHLATETDFAETRGDYSSEDYKY